MIRPARVNVDVAAVRTFDQVALSYDTSGAQFAGPVAERLVGLAKLTPGQRVLDAGCGAGAVLTRAAVAVAPGGHVTGIDLAPRMLARAATEARRRRLTNIDFLLGSAGRTPFAPGVFDVVLSSLVLHLLPDPARALGHWLRLVVPGGTVGFSWRLKPDPRWSPVFQAVDRHAGNMGGSEEQRAGRLGSPRRIRGLLGQCGYVQIATSTAVLLVRYDNAQQWWDASWSEGPLVVWRKIPESELDIARREAFELLGAMKEPDGSLIRRVGMGFAIAHRPAATAVNRRAQEPNGPVTNCAHRRASD